MNRTRLGWWTWAMICTSRCILSAGSIGCKSYYNFHWGHSNNRMPVNPHLFLVYIILHLSLREKLYDLKQVMVPESRLGSMQSSTSTSENPPVRWSHRSSRSTIRLLPAVSTSVENFEKVLKSRTTNPPANWWLLSSISNHLQENCDTMCNHEKYGTLMYSKKICGPTEITFKRSWECCMIVWES